MVTRPWYENGPGQGALRHKLCAEFLRGRAVIPPSWNTRWVKRRWYFDEQGQASSCWRLKVWYAGRTGTMIRWLSLLTDACYSAAFTSRGNLMTGELRFTSGYYELRRSG